MRPADHARLEEEAAARRDLLDATSMLERAGMIDVDGHASIRLADGRILVSSCAAAAEGPAPEGLCLMDAQGEAPGGASPPLEHHIHTEIYKARRDVNAVIHAHPRTSTLFTSVGVGIEAVTPEGCLVAGLPVWPDPLPVTTPARGAALAEALGQARGILLRAHGSVTVGTDILEAFMFAVHVELNAGVQAAASGLGRPYVFSETEIAAFEAALYKRGRVRRCWEYHRGRMSRHEGAGDVRRS